MLDLRSSREVRSAMRQVFGAAAKIDPNTITDAALLHQPPPPADNLNLPAGAVAGLIVECATRLLGSKITTLFKNDIVLPDALARRGFGSLADLLHAHLNSLVVSAVFLTVCEGLGQNPQNVTISTPIRHVNDQGRLTFMMRVRDSVRLLICGTSGFEFTQTRGTSLMDAKRVDAAMDATIGGLKDAIENRGCI